MPLVSPRCIGVYTDAPDSGAVLLDEIVDDRDNAITNLSQVAFKFDALEHNLFPSGIAILILTATTVVIAGLLIRTLGGIAKVNYLL